MIHENYEEFIAGDATKTNWPQQPETARRKDKVKYFVDRNNITVGGAKTLTLARSLAKLLGGAVRRHVVTEEQLVHEAAEHRQRQQAGDYTAD